MSEEFNGNESRKEELKVVHKGKNQLKREKETREAKQAKKAEDAPAPKSANPVTVKHAPDDRLQQPQPPHPASDDDTAPPSHEAVTTAAPPQTLPTAAARPNQENNDSKQSDQSKKGLLNSLKENFHLPSLPFRRRKSEPSITVPPTTAKPPEAEPKQTTPPTATEPAPEPVAAQPDSKQAPKEPSEIEIEKAETLLKLLLGKKPDDPLELSEHDQLCLPKSPALEKLQAIFESEEDPQQNNPSASPATQKFKAVVKEVSSAQSAEEKTVCFLSPAKGRAFEVKAQDVVLLFCQFWLERQLPQIPGLFEFHFPSKDDVIKTNQFFKVHRKIAMELQRIETLRPSFESGQHLRELKILNTLRDFLNYIGNEALYLMDHWQQLTEMTECAEKAPFFNAQIESFRRQDDYESSTLKAKKLFKELDAEMMSETGPLSLLSTDVLPPGELMSQDEKSTQVASDDSGSMLHNRERRASLRGLLGNELTPEKEKEVAQSRPPVSGEPLSLEAQMQQEQEQLRTASYLSPFAPPSTPPSPTHALPQTPPAANAPSPKLFDEPDSSSGAHPLVITFASSSGENGYNSEEDADKSPKSPFSVPSSVPRTSSSSMPSASSVSSGPTFVVTSSLHNPPSDEKDASESDNGGLFEGVEGEAGNNVYRAPLSSTAVAQDSPQSSPAPSPRGLSSAPSATTLDFNASSSAHTYVSQWDQRSAQLWHEEQERQREDREQEEEALRAELLTQQQLQMDQARQARDYLIQQEPHEGERAGPGGRSGAPPSSFLHNQSDEEYQGAYNSYTNTWDGATTQPKKPPASPAASSSTATTAPGRENNTRRAQTSIRGTERTAAFSGDENLYGSGGESEGKRVRTQRRSRNPNDSDSGNEWGVVNRGNNPAGSDPEDDELTFSHFGARSVFPHQEADLPPTQFRRGRSPSRRASFVVHDADDGSDASPPASPRRILPTSLSPTPRPADSGSHSPDHSARFAGVWSAGAEDRKLSPPRNNHHGGGGRGSAVSTSHKGGNGARLPRTRKGNIPTLPPFSVGMADQHPRSQSAGDLHQVHDENVAPAVSANFPAGKNHQKPPQKLLFQSKRKKRESIRKSMARMTAGMGLLILNMVINGLFAASMLGLVDFNNGLMNEIMLIGGTVNMLMFPLYIAIKSRNKMIAKTSLLLLVIAALAAPTFLGSDLLSVLPFEIAKIGMLLGAILSPALNCLHFYASHTENQRSNFKKFLLARLKSVGPALFVISEILTFAFALLIVGSFIPEFPLPFIGNDFSVKPMMTMPFIIAGMANMALFSAYTFFSKTKGKTNPAVKGLTLMGLTVMAFSAAVLLNPEPSSEVLFILAKAGMLTASVLVYGLGIVVNFSPKREERKRKGKVKRTQGLPELDRVGSEALEANQQLSHPQHPSYQDLGFEEEMEDGGRPGYMGNVDEGEVADTEVEDGVEEKRVPKKGPGRVTRKGRNGTFHIELDDPQPSDSPHGQNEAPRSPDSRTWEANFFGSGGKKKGEHQPLRAAVASPPASIDERVDNPPSRSCWETYCAYFAQGRGATLGAGAAGYVPMDELGQGRGKERGSRELDFPVEQARM